MGMIERGCERLTAAFTRDEDGATAIEYGLIAALIAVAIIGSMTALSSTMSDNFSVVEVELRTAG